MKVGKKGAQTLCALFVNQLEELAHHLSYPLKCLVGVVSNPVNKETPVMVSVGSLCSANPSFPEQKKNFSREAQF